MSVTPTTPAPSGEPSPPPASTPGPWRAEPPAPGYTGVTSNGYGYTGYAPETVPSPSPGPYRTVVAPTPAPAGSLYDQTVATALTLPVTAPTTTEIIRNQDVDTLSGTTPERIREDQARTQLYLELKAKDLTFDGSREAWLWAEIESHGAVQERYKDLLEAFEGASRVLNRTPIYEPNEVGPAPMPLMFQRPAPPP